MRAAPLVNIPANLIIGAAGPRRRLVQRLLDARGPDQHWAVLDNAGTGLSRDDAPQLEVSTLADACMCCNAITMKVALTALIREARPARLLILPSPQANIPQLLRLLSDQWLAPVLQLRAVLAAIEVAEEGDVWDGFRNPDVESLCSHAQIIVLHGGQEQEVAMTEQARDALKKAMTPARLVFGEEFEMSLLDNAGPAVRTFFSR